MPKAYSYIRFSSKIQEKGDSLRRQKQLAVAYCERHGLELVTSYEDLALSAYKSDNSKTGALSVFLKLVKDNKIPSNSWLLVESLDRLSRDAIEEAIGLFISIKSSGITIVSLQDEKVYKGGGSNDNNTFDLMMAMMVFMRANNESETKSKRVKAAWSNKRATGQRLTRICPSWLRWDDLLDNWGIVDSEVSVIKLIFDMAYNGDGSHVIAKTLNVKGIKSATGKQWSPSMVLLRLKNKSVIGWHDPVDSNNPPIKDYYPSIIGEEVYYKVEQMIALRELNKVSGRKSKDNNVASLFSRKMICGLCGGIVRAVSRSNKKAYWRCTTAYQSTECKAQSLPVDEGEATILATLFIRLGWVLDLTDGLDNDDANIREQIIDAESKIKDLTMNLIRLRDPSPIYAAIDMLQSDIVGLRKQLDRNPVNDFSASYNRARDAYFSMLRLQAGENITEYLQRCSVGDMAGLLRLDDWPCGEGIQTYRKRLQSELMGLLDGIVVSGYEEEDTKGWYRMVRLSGTIVTAAGDQYWDCRIDLSADGPQKWLRRYRRDKI